MELANLCTTLSSKVLSLEATKTTQAKEIAMLKKRVKRLKKGKKSSLSKLKRLFKVGTIARVQSSKDEDTVLGEEVFADKEPSDSALVVITQSSQGKAKDKGKGLMIEEPKEPKSRKAQIMRDEQLTLKLQAEEEELKDKSYEEIQESFDKTMKEIETFVPMDKEVKGKEKEEEGSNKRESAALEHESSKR
ncbi:hypothetical protein Tco_1339467 [Tanacetum coccineum]